MPLGPTSGKSGSVTSTSSGKILTNSTDTTSGNLTEELTQGEGIILTTNDLSGNKTLEISTQMIVLTTDFNFGSTTVAVGNANTGNKVISIQIVVTTGFDGTGTIDVGHQSPGNTNDLIDSIDISIADTYLDLNGYEYSQDLSIVLTNNISGGTTGNGYIIITLLR